MTIVSNQRDWEIMKQRIKELEAERDRVMRENGKLNCHIDELQAQLELRGKRMEYLFNALQLGDPTIWVSDEYKEMKTWFKDGKLKGG